MLELYQFEQCPHSRRVREAMTELGLSYTLHNRTNSETEKKMIEIGGKRQVPFLVDPERSIQMYEADDIIRYLEENYS